MVRQLQTQKQYVINKKKTQIIHKEGKHLSTQKKNPIISSSLTQIFYYYFGFKKCHIGKT